MKTNKGNILAGACLAAFGLYAISVASKLPYVSEVGPGSGFFPLWLNIGLMSCVSYLMLSFLSAFTKAQQAGEQIRPGNLRVIASLTEKRWPLCRMSDHEGARHRCSADTSSPGVLAPPAAPREVVQYGGGVFDSFVKTPTWKQYVEQNQFEDGYLKGPALSNFFDDLTVGVRDVLKEAGAKVVR